MRRSPALAPLSRDHHQALAAALALVRGEDPQAATAGFLRFWTRYGGGHFAIEERHVLPALAEDEPEWAALCERVRADHARIRELALRAEQGPSADELAELGARLRDHVRFEERELFVALERELDAERLAALGEAIAAAEARLHAGGG